MIILDGSLKSLEFVLGGNVATTALDWVLSYVEVTTPAASPTGFLSAEVDGVSNNTTAVTLLAAPASTKQRQVKFLSVQNLDTASATVRINYNNNGTRRRVYQATLLPNYTLTYTDGDGWRVWTTTGALLTAPGADVVLVQTTPITDAQLKTLPTTGIQLVAAPGVGKRLGLIGTDLQLVKTSDYTNVNAAGFMMINMGTNRFYSNQIANDTTTTPPITHLTDFLTHAPLASRAWFQPGEDEVEPGNNWGPLVNVWLDLWNNLPLMLVVDNNGAGNFTGGNAANAAIATTFYVVIG